jgi:ATP-dependent Zn protease
LALHFLHLTFCTSLFAPHFPLPRSFDRSIEVRRPDYQGRLEGIKVHLREKPIAADIDYGALAALTGGMSGAQLAGEP